MRLTDLERLDRSVSEDELLASVMAIARLAGWLAYHVRNSRRGVIQGDTGFPDIIAVRVPRQLAVELKRETESPTVEQWAWLTALAVSGSETYVWRPSDLRTGEIERLLR